MSKTYYPPMVLSNDNPFKEQYERGLRTKHGSEVIFNETVTVSRTISMGGWIRLAQNDNLKNLSAHACKILVHVAMNMTMNQERIKISRKDIGMDARMFRRVMLELLSLRIIANTNVREWYWINICLLIMGSVNKHE